ncbi:MAG: L-fucose:H+ symporter permease, partial [Parvibaculales bacterium]
MTKKPLIEKKYLLAFILVTSMFFSWGLANNMTDTLLAAFKKIMSMSDFQTTFIQNAFYGAYFCFALPAAFFLKRYSYKAGILVGLAMFITGGLLFYPASQTMVYGHFLIALYILAGGLSFLETSANPYIVRLGDEETGPRRLNFAQSFNPLGSIMGIGLSGIFILPNLYEADAAERATMAASQLEMIQQEELSAVMNAYVGVAIVLIIIWILIYLTSMPHSQEKNTKLEFKAFGRLFRNKNYIAAVGAQFLYVGVQIGVWSFTIRYVMGELGVNETGANKYYLASLICFLLGRFACTWLMGYIAPTRLLYILALMAAGLTLIVVFGSGMTGVISLILISACLSLMFPTIYALGIRNLDEDTKLGGAGLVMAIIGGAVLTNIQGLVSDSTNSIHLAYLVPFMALLFIALDGYK